MAEKDPSRNDLSKLPTDIEQRDLVEMITKIADPTINLSEIRSAINDTLDDYLVRNKLILTLIIRHRLMSIEKMITLMDRIEHELLENPTRINKFTPTKDLIKLMGEINRHLVTLLSFVQEVEKEDIRSIVSNMNVMINSNTTYSKEQIEELRTLILSLKHKLGE